MASDGGRVGMAGRVVGPGASAAAVAAREFGGIDRGVGEAESPLSRRRDVVAHARALQAQRKAERAVDELMGVFTAFDEDGDEYLNRGELETALLSLGIEPKEEVLSRFHEGKEEGEEELVDLDHFVRVCMELDDDVPSTLDEIQSLISDVSAEVGDGRGEEMISAGMLRHLLADVALPSALSEEEAATVLRMVGLLPDASADDAIEAAEKLKTHTGTSQPIHTLLSTMRFHPPPKDMIRPRAEGEEE